MHQLNKAKNLTPQSKACSVEFTAVTLCTFHALEFSVTSESHLNLLKNSDALRHLQCAVEMLVLSKWDTVSEGGRKMVWCGYRAQGPVIGCTVYWPVISSSGAQRGKREHVWWGSLSDKDRLLPPMGLENWTSRLPLTMKEHVASSVASHYP